MALAQKQVTFQSPKIVPGWLQQGQGQGLHARSGAAEQAQDLKGPKQGTGCFRGGKDPRRPRGEPL